MGSNISFKSQKKAAKHLAFARDQLRCDLMLRGFERLIPQPEFAPSLGDEENDSDSDSDSDSEFNSTDSETDSIDRTDDVIMNDAGDAQLGVCNAVPAVVSSQISLDEQNAIQNFEFVHTTIDDMDLSEGAQNQRDGEEPMEDIVQTRSEEKCTETYTYPDPEASEMVPPPTPILSYAELPLPSIEIDNPSNDTIETADVVMQDSGDGHLSDTPNTGTTLLSIEIDAPNKTTTNETSDGIMKDSEDEDLSNVAYLLLDKPWWQEFQNWLRAKQRITQQPLLSLGYVADHCDDFTETPTSRLVEAPLPRQPAAEEPSPLATHVGKVEQDERDDAVLALIIEDMETMEAEAEAARAKRERRQTRCRVHNALDSEHFNRPKYCRGRPPYLLPVDTREPRPYTREKIQAIRTERFSMPSWKKYCVWQRSLLVKETKLTPLLDLRGLRKTWCMHHKGKGPTGGGLQISQWRYCNLCEGDCQGR